jgi:uncharacterized protein
LRALAGILLIAIALAPAAAAVEVPANDGWVTDLAGMLTPRQETDLETLMESYKQGSGNEIALLTVPDLGGNSVERYALEVGRGWGMGEKDKNNAALLLIARDERKIRIEVARGLEGTLTDSISGRIIRSVITPRFRNGQIYEGIRDGILAMQAAAGGDYASIPPERGGKSKGGGWAGLIPVIFFLIFMFGVGRRGRAGGCLPWLALGALSASGSRSSGWTGGGRGGFGGGGFGGFGGGGGFSGGGASGGW